MFILNQLFKLIKLLNSAKGAWSLAAGFALGVGLGLIPSNPLLLLVLLLPLFLLQINGAATFLAWAVVGLLAYALDGLLDQLGYWFLTMPAMQSFFTQLYNMPLVPWSRFNNSIVAGGVLLSLCLFLPLLFTFKWLIDRYRASVLVAITHSKWVKAIQSTKLYQLYHNFSQKYDNLKGAL